ncbi:hypothetical protein [Gordonia sihwensis]|uniref:hypothetical protein n=1 Tax=Gordonia sihwensis TaxID=173559 RepID=UPI003D9676B6
MVIDPGYPTLYDLGFNEVVVVTPDDVVVDGERVVRQYLDLVRGTSLIDAPDLVEFPAQTIADFTIILAQDQSGIDAALAHLFNAEPMRGRNLYRAVVDQTPID